MIRRPSSKRTTQGEDFTVTIRQARCKINESYRESNVNFAENDEKMQYRKYIKAKFHSVECRWFLATNKELDDKNSKCMCGEIKKSHKENRIPYSLSESWLESNCLEMMPTDSFGKIEFVGEDITNSKLTDFVRVSYNDKLDDILDLIFNKWKITVGTLCISVIGGTIDFKMHHKEKNIFCQGLIKAAITTNALIITPGLDKGITSVIGDAIQYSQSYLYDKMKHNNFISCLGIAPWGYVKNRNILESAKGKTVHYNVSNEVEKNQPIALNKNHTHYVFVDDGYRLQISRKKIGYFRQALENKISQKQGDREGIPVVLLIVEGGHDIFIEASRRVKENVPIVVCEGTGKASDIIGEAFREMLRICTRHKLIRSDGVPMLPEVYRNVLERKLIEQNISKPHQVDEAIRCIEDIIKNEFLITLFDIKSHEDLDFAILYSLIKRMDFLCDSQQNPLSSQLSLCLIWNRVDIVKDKIFSGDISLSNDEWAEFLKESIINGKVKFIQLFLENVSNIQDFLTANILKELYETCPKSTNFRKTFLRLIGRPFSKGLQDVKELLSKMIGFYEYPCSQNDNIKHPFQELFLWAVLMEKQKCAKFFWGKCDESLFLALVATRIYECHQGTSIRDTDRRQTLETWKGYFENLAVKLIEECHDIDQEIAAYLIEKKNQNWGGISCLELANKSKDLKFMSNIVCQNSIEFTWRAGFNINLFNCILCIIFPFLISQRTQISKDFKACQSESFPDFHEENYCSSLTLKLRRFYLAPQTKFCIHSFTFISFIIYFSYVVLYGMKRMQITIHEIIFIIYLVLMILDKFVEMFQSKSDRIYDRIKYWWKFNHWNKVDMLIIILSIAAMVLRYKLAVNDTYINKVIIYRWSKTMYSVIVGLFYLKILRLLTCHRKLGPKIVMMSNIIKELLLFSIIIIIFLLSYGVTSQAGYYPQRDFSWIALSNILDYPYWTMFGVLNLGNTVYFTWCNSSTNYAIPNECPENNFLIPIIYAAYVIISNILLVNILVATFSYICQDIHRNSVVVWKYNMYSLILEYNNKPILPMPFSIFVYIFQIFSCCFRKGRCYNLSNKKKFEVSNNNSKLHIDKPIAFKHETLNIFSSIRSDSDLNKLIKYFENYSQKFIIKNIAIEKQKSLKSGISRMEFRSKSIFKELESIQTKLNKIQVKNIQNEQEHSFVNKNGEYRNLTKHSKVSMEYLLKGLNNNILVLQDEIKRYGREPNNKNQITKSSPLITVDNIFFENKFLSTSNMANSEKFNTQETLFVINESEKENIINEFRRKNVENANELRKVQAEFENFKIQTLNSLKNIEAIMRNL